MVVADTTMVRIYELLRRLAASPLPVLLHGETGSGKENAAWALHFWSSRRSRPFVALNCAALPESLAESELFGYARGAFSGADRDHEGLLERSSGGTLFLDEVAELSPSLQAKLLRVLDQKRLTRLGDSQERTVDLRLVAASHRVLTAEVKAGRFREDLFFRLSAAVVVIPPLRERPSELLLLAHTFLEQECERAGRPPLSLSASAMSVLSTHPWPGNVRELKNAMGFLAATVPGSVAEPSHLPEFIRNPGAGAQTLTSLSPARAFRPLMEELQELERQRMVEALEAAEGVQTRAAQLLGMPLRTFVFKLKKHRLTARKASRG
jgi:DNA-binding NtrC family response regulator